MIKKNFVWICLFAVILLGQIPEGSTTVADVAENEPWGGFYTPTYGDSVNGNVDVSFFVDGYSENISIDLYIKDTDNYALYVADFYGKGLHNYSWDSTTVDNGIYYFCMDLYDHDYYSSAWMNDSASEFTVSNTIDKIRYNNNSDDYIMDFSDHKTLFVGLEFEVMVNSTYSFEFTLRNVKDTTTYSPSTETFYCEIGFTYVEFSLPTIIICTDFDGRYIFDYIRVTDVDDGNTEALYLEDFGETRIYSLSELVTYSEKISYVDGNHTDCVNDMGTHHELIIDVLVDVQYSSGYRLELVISDGHGNTWSQIQGGPMNPGLVWVAFTFNSEDIVTDEWSNNGGGPFYLQMLTICDQNTASLDYYALDFGQTDNYTPGDLGAEEQVIYTGNFNVYVDFEGETTLAFDFEFEINKGSIYRGELAIKDNLGVIWYANWYGYDYISEGKRWFGKFEILANDILNTNFTGSQFFLHNLKIYDQNGSALVSDIWDFGNTGYYNPSDFEGGQNDVNFYGDWYEEIQTLGDIKGLVFFFEIDVFKQSNYRFELSISDDRGLTWNGNSEEYCYYGMRWVSIPFWSDYLFDYGFDGSIFYVDHLRIFDMNDYNREVLNAYDLGQTDYYSRSDLESASTTQFGVQQGDVLEYYVNSFIGNEYAQLMLGSSFLMNEGVNVTMTQGDFFEYHITLVSSSEVLAEVIYNGDNYGEVTLYSSMQGSSFIIPLNELVNFADRFSYLAEIIETPDSYIVRMIGESGPTANMTQEIVFSKTTGVLTSIVIDNYYYEDSQIEHLEITGNVFSSGESSSTGFTFSTPGFELLLIILAMPLIAYRKKKKE